MPFTKEDAFKFYEIDRLNKVLGEARKQTKILEGQERERKAEAARVDRVERARLHDETMTRRWGPDWNTPAGQRRIYVAKMVEQWGPNWDSRETRILRQKREDEEAAKELAEREAMERSFADAERQIARASRVKLTLLVAVVAFVGWLLLPVFQGGQQTESSSAPANRASTIPETQPTVAHSPLAIDPVGTEANGFVAPSDPAQEAVAPILEASEQQEGVEGELPEAALPDVVSATTQEPGPEMPKELLKAAKKGNAPAQYALGSTLEARNAFSEARGWLMKAASSGYAGAQFKLGEFAEKGLAGDRDLDEAVRWYGKAAAQGFEPAKLALARLDRSR